MANIIDSSPDPDDATSDPKAFGGDSLKFMVMSGVSIGLAKIGAEYIGGPMQNGFSSLINLFSNASEQASTEETGDFEVL